MTKTQTLHLHLRLARPDQLLAVTLVYIWGVLLALGHTLPGTAVLPSALAGLLPLLLVSASIHYANEYADAETDALTQRTPFSGGSGALAAFGADRRVALADAILSLAAGLVLAALLLWLGWLPPLALGLLLLGALGGWMYSLPPLALAWRGWGELDNALLGGILLPAYGFAVLVGRLDAAALWVTLPFALLVFVNLLATTWADRAADAQVGKWTLATRWPVRRLRLLYGTAVVLVLLALLALRGPLLPDPLFWASLLVLPAALWAGLAYTRRHSPFPSVFTMILFLLVQLGGRLLLAINNPAAL